MEGTILARKAVDDTVTATADVGNTGNGTVTLATVFGSIIPIIGAYNLEIILNNGTFKLENPNGALIESRLNLMLGIGATTIFTLAGLQFTVTNGSIDFAEGDKFALIVTANGKLFPFDPN